MRRVSRPDGNSRDYEKSAKEGCTARGRIDCIRRGELRGESDGRAGVSWSGDETTGGRDPSSLAAAPFTLPWGNPRRLTTALVTRSARPCRCLLRQAYRLRLVHHSDAIAELIGAHQETGSQPGRRGVASIS